MQSFSDVVDLNLQNGMNFPSYQKTQFHGTMMNSLFLMTRTSGEIQGEYSEHTVRRKIINIENYTSYMSSINSVIESNERFK